MTLQTSGPISLDDIQTEFGGTNPISLNEYYAAAAGIPASGAISLQDFYGATAAYTLVCGVSGGTTYGFSSNLSIGSISPTTYSGATISQVAQSEIPVKGGTVYNFNITMSGNRATSFFASVTFPTYGALLTSASSSSYNSGSNTTTWTWTNTHVTEVVDGATLSIVFA